MYQVCFHFLHPPLSPEQPAVRRKRELTAAGSAITPSAAPSPTAPVKNDILSDKLYA